MQVPSLLLLAAALVLPAAAGDEKAKNKDSKDSQMHSDLFAKEKAMWDAWTKKDVKPLEEGMAQDAVMIDMTGVMDRAASLKMAATHNCDFKSYSFSEEKVTPIDKDAVILTYKATVDGTCDGQKIPESVYASSVWKKQNGKWLAVSHQETPAAPPQPMQQ